ncbi:MAG: hypothetical protein Q7K65_00990 [Candidatus Buchananbacteria bacterium]|nr:hypothetical protein [Candidatus Buchananbacteria bacterium]
MSKRKWLFKEYLSVWLFSFIVIVLALIPTWIYLSARFLFDPESALVEILLFGVSLYFFGGIQIIAIVIAIAVLIAIWE